MRFPMDAVFLDKNMQVKRVVPAIRPFRMRGGDAARAASSSSPRARPNGLA